MSSFSVMRSINDGVYFDHNATTPVAEKVAIHLTDWVRLWGNPSSIHWAGRGPKALMRDARKQVSEFLQCDPLELVFTSGGTEATNMALKGLFDLQVQKYGLDVAKWPRNELIVSAVEHPATMAVAESLMARGLRLHKIPVHRSGKFDLEAFEQAVTEKTLLVSVMFANNETGQLLPMAEIVERAHRAGALVHCDMVQTLGKVEVSLTDLKVDYASFSAHKFYALKGCGALFIRRGAPFREMILGGRQERRRRGGTENTLSIAAFGEMAKTTTEELKGHIDRVTELRNLLENKLLESVEDVEVLCQAVPRLGNTTSVLVKECDGESLLMNLDLQGFAVSTGAACSSGSPEPSPVLLAMGLSRGEAQQSLRISLGWGTTEDQVLRFIEALKITTQRLRKIKRQAGEG